MWCCFAINNSWYANYNNAMRPLPSSNHINNTRINSGGNYGPGPPGVSSPRAHNSSNNNI